MSDPYRGHTWSPGPPPAPVDLDALPGIDEQLLAAGEDQALVRLLVDRHGFDEDTAREIVAAELDVGDADCHCDECQENRLAELRAFVEPPWITLTPNPRYL